MADFKTSVMRGFRSLARRSAARAEIELVFQHLSDAVLSVTGGKVGIELRQSEGDERWGIFAVSMADVPEHGVRAMERLGFVTPSDGAYPLRLEWANIQTAYIVGERTELEAAISEAVENVRVAERIRLLAELTA